MKTVQTLRADRVELIGPYFRNWCTETNQLKVFLISAWYPSVFSCEVCKIEDTVTIFRLLIFVLVNCI